jgi:hypothetical protein
MIDCVKIIQLAMESLKMNENGSMTEGLYNSILHDLKSFAMDMKDVKQKVEELSDNERIGRLEERTDILLLEFKKLKYALDRIIQIERTPINKIRK